MATGSTIRTLRVPPELWDRFVVVCRSEGRSASEALREFMASTVEEDRELLRQVRQQAQERGSRDG